jgi:putative membrane protein
MRNSPASRIGLASVLLLALAVTACGDDDNGIITDDAIAEGEQLGDDRLVQLDIELGDELDANVLMAKTGGILITIDENEIAQAEFVLDVALDPDVISFAQRMIAEHTAHLASVEDLLVSFDLVPVESTVSAALRSENSSALDRLDRVEDVDFEYMRLQVVVHNEAFVIVDELQDLAPNDQFQLFLTNTLDLLEDHRSRAESLLRLLE